LGHGSGDNITIGAPINISKIAKTLCLIWRFILLRLIVLTRHVSEGAGVEALGDDVLAFPGFRFKNQFGTS